ncbi:UNVERIFIED_CONTAM: hypothetical protein PYX00_002325 [Menopon gallinae]|uniref:Endonuclease n=1 Tax=Menopon gallinae TaxID=328185 RepID=A0AAW2IG96_9NEOP
MSESGEHSDQQTENILAGLKLMKISELKEVLKKKNLKTTGKKEELCRRLAAALVLEAERGTENEDADDDECEDQQYGDEGATNEYDEEGDDDGDGDAERRRVPKTNFSPQKTTMKPNPRREEANRTKTKRMNFSFRDIEDLMRPFEGHAEYPIEKWIKDFEEYAELLGMSDLEKLVFGKKMMKGDAAILIRSRRGLTTWRELKHELMAEFHTRTSVAEIHKLMMTTKKKPEESEETYLLRMEELASRGNIDRERNKREGDHRPKESKIKCFNCGEENHFSKNCPSKNLGVKCFKCKQYGHRANECKGKASNVKVVKSNRKRLEDENYRRDVNIDGKIVKAYIDAGSEVTTIRTSIIEEWGMAYLPSSVTMRGFGQGLSQAKGERTLLLDIEGVQIEGKVLLVPDEAQEDEMIIGRNILSQPGIRVTIEGQKLLIERKQPTESGEKTVQIKNININHEIDDRDKEKVRELVEEYDMLFPTDVNMIEKTKPTIECLQEIFSYFGTPTRLITDRGSAFTSRDFEKFCEDHQIQHVKNATGTPKANGQAERQNQTLLSALKTMCEKPNAKDWSRQLKQIQFALNDLPNATTRKTPHELLFAYNPRSSLKNQLILALHEPCWDGKDMESERQIALSNIVQKQQQDKTRYDSRHKKPTRYKEGDCVLVKKEYPATGESRKLLPKYKGPYMIRRCLPHDRYVLVSLPGEDGKARRRHFIFATDRLKPWCKLDEDTEESESEVAESDQEEDKNFADGAEDGTDCSVAECHAE